MSLPIASAESAAHQSLGLRCLAPQALPARILAIPFRGAMDMNNLDPAGQYKCLFKHFFRRFFDFDAISSPQIDSVEKNALTFQIVALVVLPSAVISMLFFQKYAMYTYRPTIERDLATLTDKCLLLSLSMILLGFIAVFEWDMLFPDRKDYQILTPFPVATRTIFFSKIAALGAFLLIFTAAVNILPALFFPNAVLANNGVAYRIFGKRTPVSLILRYIASHGASILLANLFIFLSAISLQGILLMIVPKRLAPAASRCVRFFCLLLLLCALFSFFQISRVDQLIYSAMPITAWYPPIWFVGIYETLLGSHDPVLGDLSGRAILALVLSAALSILSYAVCYRRFLRRSIESGRGVSRSSAAIRSAGNFVLDRWLLRQSDARASFHFVGQTIFRSSRHVLYLGTFFVVGFAIAALELATAIFGGDRVLTGRLAILSIPLVLSFFLLVGMRVSFAIPAELEANWLFRIAPIQRIRGSHKGLRRFMIFVIIIPLFVIVGLLYGLFWNWQEVLLHLAYCVTLSLILMELLFARFPKIPFTCSYVSGKAQIVILWPFYVLGFQCFGYAAASLEIWLRHDSYRYLLFYVISAALLLILAQHNRRSGGRGMRFEELPDRSPIYLDLKN